VRIGATVAFLVTGLALAGAAWWLDRSRQPTPPTAEAVARARHDSVLLLAGYPAVASGAVNRLTGFCSAFAVAPEVLATNAHCLALASRAYRGVVVLQNGAAGRSWRLGTMWLHPGWKEGTVSPDVGLARVEGRLPSLAPLADRAVLDRLGSGARVYLYGFPGRLSDPVAPEATFVAGELGRVTTFDRRPGDPGTSQLLQHSAYSAGGTSGSPLLDSAGRVIGLHAGGYLEGRETLTGYNLAMRIDLLDGLLPYALAGSPR